MVSDNHYCQNLIAKAGAPVYYSALNLNESQKQAIFAVRALAKEVGDIVFECEDSTVAYAKYAWWQGEIQQLASTTPTHPVTKELQLAINKFKIPIELFQEFMVGIGNNLEKSTYQTRTDLFHYHHHTAGVIERINTYILGFSDENTLTAVDYFGVCIQMIRHLQNLRAALRRHRTYIALSDLDEFHLSLENLQSLTISSALRNLLNNHAQQINHYYELGLTALPKCDRFSQLSTIILVEINMALLRQLLSKDSNLLQQFITLTPLRMLKISWLVKRREKKLMRCVSK